MYFFWAVFLAQILYLNTQPLRYLFYLIEALEVRLGHKVKVVCEDDFFLHLPQIWFMTIPHLFM
jgi:hypothetical protein